ncbi:hypothetical protein GCM10023157_08440 [Gluconacetobacter asukensis]
MNRLVAISSTSRFTKQQSTSDYERRVVEALAEGEAAVESFCSTRALLDLEDCSYIWGITESNATQIFTDETWAVREPLIEAVRPPSRGGYGTKVCVVADGRGRAVTFTLAPGQAHELPLAPAMLDRLPREPLWVVGDKGYVSNAFREHVWTMGARPAIPPKRRDAAVACPQWAYRNRHLVEDLRARLKEWRAVATRYEKTAASFLAILHLAAAAGWIKI